MKPKALLQLLATAVSALVILSGCKPREISGQAFFSGDHVLTFPIAGMEVCLVRQKDTDLFLDQKKSEIAQKVKELRSQVDKVSIEFNQAEKLTTNAQADYRKSEKECVNDPRYIEFQKQKDETSIKIAGLKETLRTIRLHEPQGGQMFTSAQAGANYQAAVDKNTAAQNKVYAQLREQEKSLEQITSSMKTLREAIIKPYRDKVSSLLVTSAPLGDALQKAKMDLQGFPKPSDYLNDFSPVAVSKTTTDSKGDFTLDSTGGKLKAFAKIKLPDSSESVFWLVDLPQKEGKLILSNNNLFAVPNYD